VRTFGQPTYGMTTANTVHQVPDGASLLLSMARYAQGTEAPYHGAIQPDETVATSAHQELAVRAAAQWAASQAPACRVKEQMGSAG
jgi:C-terminal processing protease CtpA/Prc